MSEPYTSDRMTEEEYRKAYNNAKEDSFAGTAPSPRPRAIILAGQPGAGKGVLKAQAQGELADGAGAVSIDPDDLRDYHPGYRKMAPQDYRSAATRVHLDASQMAKDLRRNAIEERRNVVIDGTLKDPERAERLCNELREAGYEVDVWALAVHERVSRRGVAERLENGFANPAECIPRDVPNDVQEEAYHGMPNAVERIEHAGAADRISVYRRGAVNPLYTSGSVPPPRGQDAKAAILAEREREMSSLERVDHAQKWDKIAAMATVRHAPIEEQERYDAARAEAHVELHGDLAALAEYKKSATAEQMQQSAGYCWASKAPVSYAEVENREFPEKDDSTLDLEK